MAESNTFPFRSGSGMCKASTDYVSMQGGYKKKNAFKNKQRGGNISSGIDCGTNVSKDFDYKSFFGPGLYPSSSFQEGNSLIPTTDSSPSVLNNNGYETTSMQSDNINFDEANYGINWATSGGGNIKSKKNKPKKKNKKKTKK